MEAHRDAPSTKDDASVDAAASLPLREQTTTLSEYYPSGPEDAERKTTAAADDVMIQIRARKSEVSPPSADPSAVLAVTFF